jgi:light-regulated signal transduction histidine kinase (bacteriophytochrome)
MLVEQDTNCRTVGRCTFGAPLDREVGDMIPRDAQGTKISLTQDLGRAFLYVRYNAELSAPGLAALGLPDIKPQDVQKLDAASLELRGEFVDPLDCVRSSVEQLQGEAERREIEILCHLPQESKPLFATIETLRRIALNLLQNAIQHTLHGGRVQVEWIDKDEWAELRVRDHGNGIPEQILPHIFDRFYRGPGHHGDTPGIGLGLAVTQMFVTALGGRIQVESAPGKGSEFTVILPRR